MAEKWLRRIARSLAGRPTGGSEAAVEVAPAARGPGPLSHDEVVDTLRRLVVQHSDGTRSLRDVGAGDHLYERGHVDSMGAVALLTFIEGHYGVTVDEADLVARLPSLDNLAGHILASATPASEG